MKNGTITIDYYPRKKYLIVSSRKWIFFKHKIFNQTDVSIKDVHFIKEWYKDINWDVVIINH